MLAKIKVVEQADYDKWQSDWEGKKDDPTAVSQLTPVEQGKELFTTKGCVACHSVTGERKAGVNKIGPDLNSMFGKMGEFEDGAKVMRDENYIRESLMNPTAKIVKGFQPLMPTFRGTLSDEEVNAIVAYIKSLKE